MSQSRQIRCQVCSWQGVRTFGQDGILVEPCPAEHRVTYAVIYPGDQPVTADNGELRQPSQKRSMSPEHKVKVMAALATARQARKSAA
jgi:hypothetical protein